MSVGLHLCDDLIFESRVAGTAQHFGLALRTVRKWADIASVLADGPFDGILVDLQFPGLEIAEFPALAKQASPDLFLLGYGSHVAVETLKKAREAGFDLVLPRSKFVEELPKSLGTWLKGTPEAHGRLGQDA